MDPSDHEDQLSGMIDLSFLASNSFANEVNVALPKSNLILFLINYHYLYFVLNNSNLFETVLVD